MKMNKIKKCTLISCVTFILMISYPNKALTVVEFEKGEPSQIRELILKQKQEKEKLIREKYKKKQEEKKKKSEVKEKVEPFQKQPTSFTKLRKLLIIGLLLLTIVSISLGFVLHYRRQRK